MFKKIWIKFNANKTAFLVFWLNLLFLILMTFLLSFNQNIDTGRDSECTLYTVVSLVVSNLKKCANWQMENFIQRQSCYNVGFLGQTILIFELKSQFLIFQWKGGGCDEWCLQYSPVLENLHHHPDSYSSLTSTHRDWNFRSKVGYCQQKLILKWFFFTIFESKRL